MDDVAGGGIVAACVDVLPVSPRCIGNMVVVLEEEISWKEVFGEHNIKGATG